MSSHKKSIFGYAAGFALAFVAVHAFAVPPEPASPDRTLTLFNTHTNEQLCSTYCTGGEYIPEALADINHILRDPLNGETKAIDPRLLDLLYRLQAKLNTKSPFYVICGYRSPRTNEALREKSAGVARYSLHMSGMAVDIRLPGVPLAVLHRAAVELKAGGVGYYPQSDFIHVDVGPVRYW